MASSFRVAGILAIAGAATGLAVLAACGDDDNNNVTTNTDAGPDGPVNTGDTGAGDPCANVEKPTRTKTAAACTAELGETAIVVDGECKKVLSPECHRVMGPIDNDDAIILGQLTNRFGVETPQGLTRSASIGLAIDEINTTAGGVYTADGCGRRPLAVVVCDDSNFALDVDAGADAGTYDRRAAARHLSEDLKVAAILGPHNSNNTIDVSNNVTTAARTMIIAPTAGAAEITNLDATVDGTRLVWRTVPSDALQSKGVRRVGEAAEAEIKAANPGKTTIKVAIVNRGDAFGRGLRDGVKANVTFNGQSWDANDAANKAEFEYAVPTAPQSLVDDLVAFNPDIVYIFGLAELASVIDRYEDAHDANTGGVTAPIWATSASGQRNEVLVAIGQHTTNNLRKRVRGTSSVLLSPLTNNFYARYKQNVDGGANQALVFGMSQSYDSVYSVAYGIAAIPNLSLTTQVASIDVAKGIAKQVAKGSLEIDIGPDKVREAMEALRKGDAINFKGATGPLDYDLAVGEAPGDYAVWCVRNNASSEPVFENATGQSWSFEQDVLVGNVGAVCN